jgi:hypothetical protein
MPDRVGRPERDTLVTGEMPRGLEPGTAVARIFTPGGNPLTLKVIGSPSASGAKRGRSTRSPVLLFWNRKGLSQGA